MQVYDLLKEAEEKGLLFQLAKAGALVPCYYKFYQIETEHRKQSKKFKSKSKKRICNDIGAIFDCCPRTVYRAKLTMGNDVPD